MNGDRKAKNYDAYCDCYGMSRQKCKHCRSHLKGFAKRYWRKWNMRRMRREIIRLDEKDI